MQTLRGRHALSALGLALLVAAAVHHGAETDMIGGTAGPLLAFALDGGIAVGVIAAGRWLAGRGLSADEEWRIAGWTTAGSTVAVVAFGATVAVRVFEGRPLVVANDGVRSVVHNLVENAVEHAGPDVTVRVAVEERDETVAVAVADDGPGLPPALRDDAFGDADDDASGLSLVATLVDVYDGSVRTGESDLGGARFEVTLPRAAEVA